MVDRRTHSTSLNGNRNNLLRLRKDDYLHMWPFPFRDACLQTTFDCARACHDGVFYKRRLHIIPSGYGDMEAGNERDVTFLCLLHTSNLVLVTQSRDLWFSMSCCVLHGQRDHTVCLSLRTSVTMFYSMHAKWKANISCFMSSFGIQRLNACQRDDSP